MKLRRSFVAVTALLGATLAVGGVVSHATGTNRVATGLSGVEGDATITLSWTDPDLPPTGDTTTNYSILGYVVSVFDAGTSALLGSAACTHAAGSSQSCPMDAYTKTDKTSGTFANGTGYTFTVVTQWLNENVDPAVQVDSDGSASSSTLTPYTKPDSPTSVAASATGTQATVTFTAPSNNGGRSVTDYTVVTYNSAGTTVINTVSLCAGSSSGSTASRTICGLSNNTGYTFKVKATNARGDSPESSLSSVLTTVPGAPAQPTATIDASGATSDVVVTWTAVGGTGTITEYEVMPYKGTDAQSSLKQTWSSGALSATIVGTGLDLGSSYTFKVRAKNSEGWGDYSTASSAVLASTKPATPNAPTASDAGTGDKATVSWSAPTANGADITAYTVTAYTASGDTSSGTCSPASLSSLSCDVSGLTTVATGYYFKVLATNARGSSAQSAKSSTLIIAAPSGSSTTTPTSSSIPSQSPTTTTSSSTTTPAPPPQTSTTAAPTTTLPSLLKPSAGTKVAVKKPAKTIAQDAAAALSKQKMTLALKSPVTSGASAVTKYVITFKTTTKGAKSITKTVAVKAGKVYTVAVTGKKATKYQIVVVAYTKGGKKSTWNGPKITTSK